MKKFLHLFIAICILICSVCFVGCGASFNSFSFTAFNTEVFITVKGEIPKEVKDSITNCVSALDEEFALTNQNSCIYKFNNGEQASLSTDGELIFNLSKEFYAFTNGKFNPAIYPLTKLWKLSADTFDVTISNYTPPSSTLIESTKTQCNFNDVSLMDNTLITNGTQTKLDFGGIVKGYATDKIAEILTAHGYTEGYVRIGGSSLYILSVPSSLSIKHPRKSGEYILSVNGSAIKNTPLSTSGDYERFYETNDERFCHIIDAVTGAPINTGISSATVFGVSGAFTDAFSTAICCTNPNELGEFINRIATNQAYGSAKFIVVNETEKQILTTFSENDITVLDSDYTLVKI